MDFQIRPIAKEESSLLAEAFKRVIEEDFPEYSQAIKNYILTTQLNQPIIESRLINEPNNFWVAFDKKKVVGFLVSIGPIGGVIIVEWIGILKEYQHQGLGKRIVEVFAKDAVAHGAHALHLYSADFNLPFYEKLGFKKIGLIKNGYYGTDDYLMVKILQEPKEENFIK